MKKMKFGCVLAEKVPVLCMMMRSKELIVRDAAEATSGLNY
jgi:hypothetical protein